MCESQGCKVNVKSTSRAREAPPNALLPLRAFRDLRTSSRTIASTSSIRTFAYQLLESTRQRSIHAEDHIAPACAQAHGDDGHEEAARRFTWHHATCAPEAAPRATDAFTCRAGSSGSGLRPGTTPAKHHRSTQHRRLRQRDTFSTGDVQITYRRVYAFEATVHAR
jgi:hypothetical protein